MQAGFGGGVRQGPAMGIKQIIYRDREGEQSMNQSSGSKPAVHVRMFGGFNITMDEKTMSDSDNRSRKAWNLLSYLIIKRRGDVSVNELFHAIWQDGMQENPCGALKTLVFRVRKMLEAAGFPSQELILSQKGAYMWNPAWETEVDTDRFECLCRRILEPEAGQDLWEDCQEAFELYRGMFLPKSSEENWVGSLAVYYHTLYRKLVVHMAKKLIADQDYAQAESICGRAVDIDRFVEEFHYYRIYAAYGRGDQKTALERYKATMDMFYRERLMTPSEHFKELYKTISNSEQEVVTDLGAIQKALDCGADEAEERGAYQCEYAVFKRLVQLERRGVERSGDSVYLCLVTVGDRKGRTLKPEIQARAMERLRAAVQKSLRSSDVYARYSVSQYIILLSSATYENSDMVMNRILSTFNKSYVRKDVAVNYSLDVLHP